MPTSSEEGVAVNRMDNEKYLHSIRTVYMELMSLPSLEIFEEFGQSPLIDDLIDFPA